MGLFADRVQVAVVGTPGTGVVTLGAASSGYRTFTDAGFTTNQKVAYVINDGNNGEIGIGTYNTTGPTLTRTTIFWSSNSNNPINASSASIVSNPFIAERVVSSDDLPFGVQVPAYDYFAATNDSYGNITQVAYYTGGSGGTNVATLVMTYNAYGDIATAVYHTGGSGGPTIATLTYAYDASQNLTSITKS